MSGCLSPACPFTLPAHIKALHASRTPLPACQCCGMRAAERALVVRVAKTDFYKLSAHWTSCTSCIVCYNDTQ